VTAERDPQATLDNDVFTYRERERAGELLAPRVFSTGVPYHGTDPPIRTLTDARDAVRPHSEYFNSETFKIYYDESTDRRARQLLALATAEAGLNATAHVNGLELDLASVIDGLSGVEHPSDIRLYDDVATLVAQSGTIHTQTYGGLTVGSLAYMTRHYGAPWDWVKMRRFVPPSILPCTCINCDYGGNLELGNLVPLISGAARIVAKQGRVGIGSHGNVPAIGYHYEMWLHALGGMSNHEILRSATIIGATAIGHAKDLGSLEPGKLADLQILEKNPLEDIRHTTSVQYVMKNGRLYLATDLTEVWPINQPLNRIYLWKSGSAPDWADTSQSVRPQMSC
jgi:imidazolonepropionase-like amidohydrolase